jgi:hypothetical protein
MQDGEGNMGNISQASEIHNIPQSITSYDRHVLEGSRAASRVVSLILHRLLVLDISHRLLYNSIDTI